MSDRPTPITDAAVAGLRDWFGKKDIVDADEMRNLERQLAERDEELAEALSASRAAYRLGSKMGEQLDAAIRERDQARADATEWAINLDAAIRELTEANEKIQGLQDGIQYATDALMREKALADRLASDVKALRSILSDMGASGTMGDASITAWKEARKETNAGSDAPGAIGKP